MTNPNTPDSDDDAGIGGEIDELRERVRTDEEACINLIQHAEPHEQALLYTLACLQDANETPADENRIFTAYARVVDFPVSTDRLHEYLTDGFASILVDTTQTEGLVPVVAYTLGVDISVVRRTVAESESAPIEDANARLGL